MSSENTAEPATLRSTANDASSDKTLGVVAYVLMLVSPFLGGLPALAGVIMAYVLRGSAPELLQSHYRGIIRIFWTYTLTVIAAILVLFIMLMQESGFGAVLATLGAFAVGLWLYALLIIGLVKLVKDKPPY